MSRSTTCKEKEPENEPCVKKEETCDELHVKKRQVMDHASPGEPACDIATCTCRFMLSGLSPSLLHCDHLLLPLPTRTSSAMVQAMYRSLTDGMFAFAQEENQSAMLPFDPAVTDPSFGFLTPEIVKLCGFTVHPLQLSGARHPATGWTTQQQQAVGSYLRRMNDLWRNDKPGYAQNMRTATDTAMKESSILWRDFMKTFWERLGGMKKIKEILEERDLGLDTLVMEHIEVREAPFFFLCLPTRSEIP
jgi:hypothetical protein